METGKNTRERVNTLLYLNVEECLRRLDMRYGVLTKETALSIEEAVALEGKENRLIEELADGLFGKRRRFGFIVEKKLASQMRQKAVGMGMSITDFVNAAVLLHLVKADVITPGEAGFNLSKPSK